MTKPNYTKNLRRLLSGACVIVLLLLPSLTSATTKVGTGFSKTQQASGLGGGSIETIVGGLIRGILGMVGVIFLLLLVWAGFMWTTAGGNQERVLKAKKIIVGAIIGMILIFGAYTIADFAVVTLTRTDVVGSGDAEGGDYELDDVLEGIGEDCGDDPSCGLLEE